MYLAIDIGGSKTLLAVFKNNGEIKESFRLPTNKDYSRFLDEIQEVITQKLGDYAFTACCCAAPGKIDRKNGVVLSFGNLPWKNVRLRRDLEKLLNHIPVFLENDAKLAGLSEALAHPKYNRVLYLTVSTGIGDGFVVNGKLEEPLLDSEPGQMMLEYDGKIRKWEDIASGRALVAEYGKRASEIEDAKIWHEFARRLARGMNEVIATLQPEVIIMGGGVGAHYEKFSENLEKELEKLANAMTPVPPIKKAKRAEEAVIYGCYDYLRTAI